MIAVAGGILLAFAALAVFGLLIGFVDSGPSWDISGTDIAITVIAVLMMLAALVTA